MPFMLRLHQRFPVYCAVTYHAGPFLKPPLAYFSGFGSAEGRTCIKMPTLLYLLKRTSKNATQNETVQRI